MGKLGRRAHSFPMTETRSRPSPLRWLAAAAQFCLGVAILLLLQKAGDAAVARFALPLPGALVGMLLLLAALVAMGRVPRPIALAAGGLLRHIMLFLMPVVAGVLDHLDLLQGHWLPFMVSCLLGTALTLVVTAALLQRLLHGRAAASGASAG